jgi:hypothetical protein
VLKCFETHRFFFLEKWKVSGFLFCESSSSCRGLLHFFDRGPAADCKALLFDDLCAVGSGKASRGEGVERHRIAGGII